MNLTIHAATQADEPWVLSVLVETWGTQRTVTRGKVHDAIRLPGLVAWTDDKRVGLLVYNLDDSMEIVTLNSLRLGAGIGSALLDEAIKTAREKRCPRIWLVTTNDNTDAIDFYESRGFNVVSIHKNAVTEARELKPEIPLFGAYGAPIRDEVEMELLLSDKT